MSLVLNEDQLMLKDAVSSFCRGNAPVSVLRNLRDSRDAEGYSRALWQQMCELGWAGMAIPEQYGGFGFGFGGLGVVLEETGRTLLPSPLVATVLLGATAITLAGSEEQKHALLPQIVSGQLLLALALVMIFAFALSWLWIIVAMMVKSPESVMTMSFVFLMPLTFASDIFVQVSTMPAWLQVLVRVNPVTRLASASRALMHGQPAGGDVIWVLIASAVIIAIAAPVAMRLYHKER